MTGISTLNRRRLPASLSRRPIPLVVGRWSLVIGHCKNQRPRTNDQGPIFPPVSIVTGNRANREDHLLVGDLLGAAGEAGVAAVRQDGQVVVGVAAQRRDQLLTLSVVQRTEIHDRSPSGKPEPPRAAPGKRSPLLRQLRQQLIRADV